MEGYLTHPNAIIELGSNIIILIASSIVLNRKSRVMGTDLGDVRVLAAAELWVIVARDGVGGDRRRGGRAGRRTGGAGGGRGVAAGKGGDSLGGRSAGGRSYGGIAVGVGVGTGAGARAGARAGASAAAGAGIRGRAGASGYADLAGGTVHRGFEIGRLGGGSGSGQGKGVG